MLILQTDPQVIHPLFNKLELLCCHLSGVTSSTEAFQKGLPKLSCTRGDKEHKNNIALTYKDGKCSVAQGGLIQFVQL